MNMCLCIGRRETCAHLGTLLFGHLGLAVVVVEDKAAAEVVLFLYEPNLDESAKQAEPIPTITG